MTRMLDLFDAARRVSVPIVVIRTADQMATATMIADHLKEDQAVLMWDAARGFSAARQTDGKTNGAADVLIRKHKLDDPANEGFVAAMLTLNAVDVVGAKATPRIPQSTMVLVHNAHRQLASAEPIAVAAAIQAVSNLRDTFKLNYRMLVLLAPAFVAPPELAQDIFLIDHELPSREELRVIITDLYDVAVKATPTVAAPTPDVLDRAVEAVTGLSHFAAEQQAAVSFTDTGLDISQLWERKRVTIEQTKGLRVWRGGERFSDLVGLDSVKARLLSRLKAKTPVGVVLFLDEIDKVFANVEHDTSGVRLDQMTTFLTEMENNEWRGLVCVGVAGGGKSALAKAFGNEAGVPTIALDLGGMEGSYIGESELAIRQAIQVIKAVGQGNAYVIATSNNAAVMRPEMQRRFTDGFFFFDIMSAEERAATWKFYLKKYALAKKGQTIQLPVDDGWTGAEIRNCCRDAWDTNSTVVEAARFIVPMATGRIEVIDGLRSYAEGRFLDANKPGPYKFSEGATKEMQRQVRPMTLPPVNPVQLIEDLATMRKES